VFEEFVVERKAFEYFVVSVFEGKLREVAGEETPGCGGAAAVGFPRKIMPQVES
jgi:hypothetical protein